MRAILAILILLCLRHGHSLAQTISEPKGLPPEWSEPYPPFRIVGNLYYVGTKDLAAYLVVSDEGNILINSGLATSDSIIKSNIEALGFSFADTKILLTTQAHFDHVGALAAIKKQTGARMWADEKDEGVLTDGGSSDYEFSGQGMTFEPIAIDRQLQDGDTIRLGAIQAVMLHHPGHTKGSSSYLMDIKDDRKTYRVLIANMPTIVTSKKFSEIPLYPDIAKDYAYTFGAMKKLTFDLFLSSHASQFGLHEKHKSGDTYNPRVFADRKRYDQSLKKLEEQYLKKMKDN